MNLGESLNNQAIVLLRDTKGESDFRSKALASGLTKDQVDHFSDIIRHALARAMFNLSGALGSCSLDGHPVFEAAVKKFTEDLKKNGVANKLRGLNNINQP